MSAPFVFTLISVHLFFRRCSVAFPPPDQESSPWFIGCVKATSRHYAPASVRDLDPVTCCAHCLDEGYQVAALSLEDCYCGNRQDGLAASGCFNGGTVDDRGQRPSVLLLPVGAGHGSLGLYRTEGPFLHSVRLSTSPDRVHAGKTFVVEVSGKLAGCPSQPTGILGVGGKELSYVTIEFQQTFAKGQSSHHVSVLDDGSFVASHDWILETPGKYELNVSVSNPLSTLSSTLHLSVLQPSPDSLVSLLHAPLGIPHCVLFPWTDVKSATVKAAYLGDPVSLQADLGDGLAARFWWFVHKEQGKNTEGNWTFETEGVHMVSVNASSASGWTQEKIRIIVVPVCESGNQETSGEDVFADVELFTTMKHLFLNLTLTAEDDSTDTEDNGIKNITITHQGNGNNHCCNTSKHDTILDDHSAIKNHSKVFCHGGNNSSGCHFLVPLRLLRVSINSSCLLPSTAGCYHLVTSLLSTSDSLSVLPQALITHKYISALWPSGSWKSAVSTRAEFSLQVGSSASRVGSRVIWIFILDDVTVKSRTTEEWNINASLTTAGRYKVTVMAFNPVSCASFCTHILVQDPVGELVLNVSSVIATNGKHPVSFTVTAGSHVTVSLLVNATVLYRNSSYATGEEATVVLFFNHTGTVVVELRAQNEVSSQNKSERVRVEENRKPAPQVRGSPTWQPSTSQSPVLNMANSVQIHVAKQAYPTNTDITFLAVAEVPDPVEFFWHFGDLRKDRTTSRTITKKYHKPGRYDVFVVVSSGRASFTSDVFRLVVQRAVKLNRLLHQASVLNNQTVTVSCRVNAGTNATFLWSFGDGPSRLGQSTEQHVYHRTGEFTVEVTVSNLISSASLSSHIFVVDRPCQPPPVKNMGPLKLQVRRYEVIYLGVTYDKEVDCDISGGLYYTWTLFDSAGQVFPLPLVDTHRQRLILPSHLLHYDTYTAIAKVQVVGSVVYSNYTVRVQVIPSPPAVLIQGGTNVFINRNITMVTLDGQYSYDPDFPTNPLSFSWTCKPVSSITSSCFHQNVPTSSPVLVFPASFLKPNFDQFRFTLSIQSSERSASSEVFLTLTPNVIRKVSVYCTQCQGDQVTWDQSFSVSASCEGCDVPPKDIQYTWSLFLVNASSKPIIEVPFCSTVDLSALSTIMDGPASPVQTPILHPPATDASQYSDTVVTSAPVSLISSKKSSMAGLTEAPGSGEEPFYHPPGEIGPPKPLYSSTEYPSLAFENSGVYSDHFGQRDIISEFPDDFDSSTDWEFSFPFLESEDLGGRLEEGDPGISAGRPTDVDGESFSPGDESVFDPALHEEEGSNLVDFRPSVVIQEPILLDLPRNPVDRGLFESYTYTGISSPMLSLRPFSLRPESRYMLEVTAKSDNRLLGRTQLFLKTNPAPKGVMCQVQPVRGTELYTHFSIFCTSGKEDLLYEYSISVGGRPPRMLYQGRDYQHYFSLPSGDPKDDYKVNVHTQIRSSAYGTATKPCPVTVQVQPSFFRDSASSSHLDPDLELSASGLRNLSALVRLGNSVEIRNYVSLLSSILNRLSLDAEANTHIQSLTRNVLISTMCELEISGQASMMDNICILRNLLEASTQVTFVSARRVTVHVQVISEQFLKSSRPVRYHLDQETLSTLVTLLSHSLQAAVIRNDFTSQMSTTADVTHDSSIGISMKRRKSNSTKQQALQLLADILQTAADLMLRYILIHNIKEHRVSTALIALYATYHNHTSTVISSGSTTLYVPASLFIHGSRQTESRLHRPCVLSMLTELTYSPYIWAHYPGTLIGPVVDLSLYKCSTRRKIPVRALIQPITIELQPRNKSSLPEYILLHNQVNYHTFNITQEHLQRAIQLSVTFMPPLNKVFPIMLLFRMFQRPTPSMHHLHRIHNWEGNATRFTLPPSYLSAAGVGHLAVLNADFGKVPRHKHRSEQVRYRVMLDTSLCLSWDGHQGAWTHQGCSTQQAETTTAVNCSCHHLRPVTVVQWQIQTLHDSTSLDPFLSVSSDLTVLGVLVFCLCLYIPALVICKRSDVASEANHIIHYLSDNSPCDPHLYAVTTHTGLCSAACMTAKVYIVLHGEDGLSQTRELQAPGCTVFRRNSKDIFIVSAADSLGPVSSVHIWHDNSGPSPSWYLKQVEVSELSINHVTGRTWLFVGECWLAVNKADGQVERRLSVCTGIGFVKMLRLKISDYMADYHMWMSVYSCPYPHSFTHTQRLSVSLLLLLGYACVNTVIISNTDNQLLFEFGIIDVSAVSVATGVFSVVAALPTAAVIAFLFRLRELELTGSGVQLSKGRKTEKDFLEDALSVNSIFEPHLSQSSLQQRAQEACRKKHQGTDLLSASTTIMENKNADKEPVIQTDVVRPKLQNVLLITERNGVDQAPQQKESDSLSESSRLCGTQRAPLSGLRDVGQALHEEKEPHKKCSSEGIHHPAARLAYSSCSDINTLEGRRFRPVSQWCHYVAWTLCLLLSLSCLLLSALLGMKFSSGMVLLWIHSLFFSLISCIFFIQPAVIMTAAVIVSFWCRRRTDFNNFSSLHQIEKDIWSISQPAQWFETCGVPQKRCSYLEKLLGARQRARFLRLVRPPTPAELRKTRGRRRRETLIYNTLKDLSIYGSMLLLMMCINYGSSFTDHYRLNKSIRNQFIRGHDDAFMSIQKPEHWWRWAQTSLLNLLYKNASTTAESQILIGEPILWKTEVSHTFQSQVSVPTPPRPCGHLDCYFGPSAVVGLGHTKRDAASRLKLLHSGDWLGGQTVSVHFTLFSPAPNLFTSVTMRAEQSPTNVLLPSANIHSVRVYHTPATWDYVVMVCQLLFILLSLLLLCDQIYAMGEQGLMGYWTTPCNWLEVTLLIVSLVYCVYYIYHSVIILEVVELLQRRSSRGHVNVSLLATWEQYIRTLRGVSLFLLAVKCSTVLRVNRNMAASATVFTRSLSSLFWPMTSGIILMVALASVGNLLFIQSSWAFSSLPRSLQTILFQCCRLRPIRGLLLCGRNFLYHGILYLSSVVWTAVVIAVVSALVRRSRRVQSRGNVFTAKDLAVYIRQRISEVTGQRRRAWIEDHMEEKTYYFEEFESLVDELLFRLNALSNSLHHMLPPKVHRYREEDSPVTSPMQEPSNMEAQEFITQKTEVADTNVNDHGETHLLRPKLDLEILQILQQRGQRDYSLSENALAPDDSKKPGTKAEQILKDRELLQAIQCTDAKYCLSKSQATHTEVVVEVLVHEEPGSMDII